MAERMIIEPVKRIAENYLETRNKVIENCWCMIVGNDTPKQEDGWLEAVDYYNCIGVESHPATPDTGIAKTELQDEDWKTAIAQKKPTIPAGAVVKITGTLQNMYGDFVKVEYNGVKYTVEPRKLDMPKTLEEQKQAIRKATLAAGAKIIENN